MSREWRVVASLSGGAGSWAATRRWVDQHGSDGVVAVFTNVKPPDASEHLGEDEDTLRFVGDAAADLGIPLVELVAAESIYEVFLRRKWLGNAQRAHCSWELKTKPARRWVDENAPGATVIVGIDWTEQQRCADIEKNWQPYPVAFPLCEKPYVTKLWHIADLRKRGIAPPRMYELGFAHANCRGCVKAGHTHWARVLQVWPETFAFHEQKEREHRTVTGQDVAILRDRSPEVIAQRLDAGPIRRDGDWWVTAAGELLPRSLPLTLEAFRHRLQAEADPQLDLFDEGGCGCFSLPDDPAPGFSSVVRRAS